MQRLNSLFQGVAFKRLSAVEIDRDQSNQHEFNGVRELRDLLGSSRVSLTGDFVYVSEDGESPVHSSSLLTWYDARRAHPTRSEYRLYFQHNYAIDQANTGDLLLVAKLVSGKFLIVVAEAFSSIESQILWLFRSSGNVGEHFCLRGFEDFTKVDISFLERRVLAVFGLDEFVPDGDMLNLLLNRFGPAFPVTREFSAFARSQAESIDPYSDPDDALLGWLDMEECLFRILERHLVSERIETGFECDVDEFINYSLSVLNRRKSRAGHAFENHLEALFSMHDLRFTRGATTEGRSRPDFLFPGKEEYNDPSYAQSGLTLVGAKISCKDRWRQVLAEGNRVPVKHLVTLEPGISVDQTQEMQRQRVQLVVPLGLHESYDSSQREFIWPVADLLVHIAQKQSAYSVTGTRLI